MPPIKNNPGVLGDDELVRAFVVRHNFLQLILEGLKENTNSSSNRHLMIVGPRGIGKTMLVRRVAAEVRSNKEHSEAWFPVVYGEESYQVTTAGEFWLEALEHLSLDPESAKTPRSIQELRNEHDDARLRERALTQLLDFADSQNKRLLLIVENLNMICEQITPAAAWKLRHTLSSEPRIMLLGTATSRFDAITNVNEAWFELFAIHDLRPLDRKETETLWHSVAQKDLKPGHVRAIRILTGGNPRLLTVLAGFAMNRSFRELMEQLVHLIDDHTEYFKGHLDALPTKERKVFVALLEHWNPASTAEVARTTRLTVNETSALLNRLVSRGAVETMEFKPRKRLYQVAERLYNIYYLMRRRGQPADRVRAAVSFMVMYYGGRQLATTIAELAREACRLPAGKTDDHFLAYMELARHTPERVWNRALGQTPQEFFDRPDAPESLRKLPKRSLVEAALKRAYRWQATEQWEQAERDFNQAIEMGAGTYFVWLYLADVLEESGKLAEARDATQKAIDADPLQATAWSNLGHLANRIGNLEEAEMALRKATTLDESFACPWHKLGSVLSKRGRHKEAEAACQRAITLDPKHANAWFDLSNVHRRAKQLDRAEEAIRKALELDPQDAFAWDSLGSILHGGSRLDLALAACREAVRLDPTKSMFWSNLGHLLTEIGPPQEAGRIWEEGISRHPSLLNCAVHIMEARLEQGVDPDRLITEAESWIEKSGRSPQLLDSMARLVLRSNLADWLPLAETWSMESVTKSPEWKTIQTLALLRAARGRWDDALETIRPSLDQVSKSKVLRSNLTEFIIQASAEGHSQKSLDLLLASPAARVLEPLVVGLQIHLGQTPHVAKEILEIAQDVATQIQTLKKPDLPVAKLPAKPKPRRQTRTRT